MVRPTTVRPCCWRSAATVEESTPPDMATATRPGCVSARSGRVSNWVAAFMEEISLGGGLLVRGGELAELGDGGGNDLQGKIDVGLRGLAAETEAQAGARFLGGQADGGEDVRGFHGAGRAGSPRGAGKTLQIERDKERFAFDAGKNEIGGVGRARSAGCVDARMRHAVQQAVLELIAKGAQAFGVIR